MNSLKKKIMTFIGSLLCLLHIPMTAVATDVGLDVWDKTITQPQTTLLEEAVAPPPPTPSVGEQAVEIAKQYIGVPYLWGGTTPAGFDCSGLMQYVYAQLGIHISRTTGTQIHDGRAVSRDELLPGDLILFGHPVHHVGMYVGDGNFIEAPYSGANVRITSLSSRSDYNCARRIVD